MTAPDTDIIPGYYFRFSDEGIIEYGNELFSSLFNTTPHDISGKHIDQIFTLSSRIFFHTHWLPMLRLQQVVNELYVSVVTSDNLKIPLLVNSRRATINGRFVTDCVGISIAGRQKFEDELFAAKKAYEAALSTNAQLTSAQNELQLHAEQLSKSYAISERQNTELKQINKIVTHDLQEPMRKLLFYSEQLTGSGIHLPPDVSKKMERLATASQTLSRTLSGLQQYIWITEMNVPFQLVDLDHVVKMAAEKTKHLHGDELLDLTTGALPAIHANEELLTLLFFYLLENTVMFRKPGAPARVVIRSVALTKNAFQNLAGRYRYNDYLRVDVLDDGIGLDPGINERIFELFYRTANSTGTGAGLSLSRKIAEHHGGTITAHSGPGSGTEISIILPVNK